MRAFLRAKIYKATGTEANFVCYYWIWKIM